MMSTSKSITVKCSLCHMDSVQTVLASASVFGEPDLDFRPPEMLRSTLKWWLMSCPYCGYVAKDISKKAGIKKHIIPSLYANLDSTLTPLTRDLCVYALLSEAKKDRHGVVEGYLWAAWACDDANDDDHAKKMRALCLKAVAQRHRSLLFPKNRQYDTQLKADLLRRTESAEKIEALRNMNTSDQRLGYATRKILLFQKDLAMKGDFAAHCRSEIDLVPYDDFFEKKSSVEPDLFLSLHTYLEKAVSPDEKTREKALNVLDDLRVVTDNRPYHILHDILLLHRGNPFDEEHPFPIEHLANAANEEFLDLLESFVVGRDTLREAVTEQNRVAMALLHQIYTSPALKGRLKNHKNAQERLYTMALEPPFGEERTYVGYIEPYRKEES